MHVCVFYYIFVLFSVSPALGALQIPVISIISINTTPLTALHVGRRDNAQ